MRFFQEVVGLRLGDQVRSQYIWAKLGPKSLIHREESAEVVWASSGLELLQDPPVGAEEFAGERDV